MLYFAYGSNLSTARLQQRIDSAQLVTTGRLNQHQLFFHKIGRDGSAKCNAFFTGNVEDILYGAVYQIGPSQKIHLDDAEGLGNGYEIKDVTIAAYDEQPIAAFTYFATRIATNILPFHWYKKHVVAGAREHCFPEFYLNMIDNIKSQEDSNIQRSDQELSIYLSQTS